MSNTLKDRKLACDTDFLFYGLTPPKSSTDDEKIRSIAAKQMARITRMNIDALILYDLQDESVRNSSPRPFPFMATLQPDFYSDNYLSGINVPCIIYKSVGKYKPDKFADWLQNATNNVSVFVGSPSVLQATNMSLRDAYRIKNEVNSQMVVGGVTIPERHHIKGDEHLRLFNKIDSFLDNLKNLQNTIKILFFLFQSQPPQNTQHIEHEYVVDHVLIEKNTF